MINGFISSWINDRETNKDINDVGSLLRINGSAIYPISGKSCLIFLHVIDYLLRIIRYMVWVDCFFVNWEKYDLIVPVMRRGWFYLSLLRRFKRDFFGFCSLFVDLESF